MKGPGPTLLALALAAAAAAARLTAQANAADSTGAVARRMVQAAIRLAEQGDTALAIAQAAQAARLAPDLADAHFLYGMLLARTSRAGLSTWGRRTDASREFNAALRLDRGNPRYLIEVARLRLKAPILRFQAERLFRRALDAARKRHDPVLESEVEAEIGTIYFRRYEAFAHRRMVVGFTQTFDWESALRDQHYTKDLLLQQSAPMPDMGETDLAQAEQYYRGGIRADSASPAANAGLLGLLAATGRDEELVDAARSFAAANDTSSRARLYLGLGLWRLHRGPGADSAFALALTRMSPVERGPLEDLSSVLRAADALAYRALPDSEQVAYDSAYWWAADPLRLTPENEIRLEHLARVAYADLLFSAPDLRLRGWQTDRGQIYIRYGPPPVLASFAPDPQEGLDPSQIGMETTVWFYPDRNLRFVFTGPPTYNYARLAGDFSSYVENMRVTLPSTYDNVPVVHGLDSIAVQSAQFLPLGDSSGTDVVFFAGIPIREMTRGVDLHQGDLQTALFVTDPARRDVVARRQREQVTFAAEAQFENRTSSTRLAVGDYLYRFEALLPDAQRAARGEARLTVAAFGRDTLSLSDIVLADRVAPKDEAATLRSRQDFFIAPNAAMRFGRTDPVHIFTEVYHLQATTPDSVAQFQVWLRLRVEALPRTGLAARVVGGMLDAIGATARGDDQVELTYVSKESLIGRDRVPLYLALDLAGAPAGTYRLDLAVKDLATGRLATRSRMLTITEGPR
jgi:GWxTD domain-containing protein